nr:hypothetical protein Iba_scaffold3550CG0050 [Ipomoea batatas]
MIQHSRTYEISAAVLKMNHADLQNSTQCQQHLLSLGLVHNQLEHPPEPFVLSHCFQDHICSRGIFRPGMILPSRKHQLRHPVFPRLAFIFSGLKCGRNQIVNIHNFCLAKPVSPADGLPRDGRVPHDIKQHDPGGPDEVYPFTAGCSGCKKNLGHTCRIVESRNPVLAIFCIDLAIHVQNFLVLGPLNMVQQLLLDEGQWLDKSAEDYDSLPVSTAQLDELENKICFHSSSRIKLEVFFPVFADVFWGEGRMDRYQSHQIVLLDEILLRDQIEQPLLHFCEL